jgi:LacI family transcriptional regulator
LKRSDIVSTTALFHQGIPLYFGLREMGKLTLEEIGKLAGVSRSTVSRVINRHPNVRPEVRERVLKVVAETGYHPDPAARSLAGQRSGIIGLVVPLAVQRLFDDPYFARLIQGISRACNAHDYALSLILFHSKEEEAKLYPRISRNQLFDGIIVTATQVEDPLIPQLLANQVPFVLDGRHEDPRVSFVDTDNVAGAYTAVSHLIRLGRKRIATITGPLDNLAAMDRKQGYLSALRGHGRLIDEDVMVSGDYTEVSGYEAMRRLLPRKPDAVFVTSDTMALGALRALRGSGVKVPDDIALVGFDDLPQAATADPPLTTLRQAIQRRGVMEVETLIDILHNGLEPSRRLIVPAELVIRASCGAGQTG